MNFRQKQKQAQKKLHLIFLIFPWIIIPGVNNPALNNNELSKCKEVAMTSLITSY